MVAASPPSAEILFEDALLLVCVKPRGVLSATDASGKPSVPSLLAPRSVYPVHRLDREVCGLMVFAKTAQCAGFLSAEPFTKEYLLLCENVPQPTEGVFDDLLYHDSKRNKTYVVQRKRNGVRQARLSYRVLQDDLVLVRLQTGRTHQIRVQFASRGFPLRGDRKYGAKGTTPLALWAWRLSFRHPDGRTLTYTLPQKYLPENLRNFFL